MTSQDGRQLSLGDLHGKVVAVAFIFTACGTTCPLLTAKMLRIQEELGPDFGRGIAFVAITVDPEHDTPEVLKVYAKAHGADVPGWTFLTGDPAMVQDVERRYGVAAARTEGGEVDHTNLTSLIDRHGMLRVQYLGVRFDPEEFRRDLLELLSEP